MFSIFSRIRASNNCLISASLMHLGILTPRDSSGPRRSLHPETWLQFSTSAVGASSRYLLGCVDPKRERDPFSFSNKTNISNKYPCKPFPPRKCIERIKLRRMLEERPPKSPVLGPRDLRRPGPEHRLGAPRHNGAFCWSRAVSILLVIMSN